MVNNEGIKYQNKTIRWEEIGEIKYQIILPRASIRSNDCSYAQIIGSNIDIKISSAPFMMLREAKKNNKNVKTALSKSSILLLTIMPLAFIILAVVIPLI